MHARQGRAPLVSGGLPDAGAPAALADEPPRTRRRSVEAAIVLASQIGTLGLSFVTGVITARIFTPEVRGEYGMFVTVVAFASVLTTFGLPEAIVYFHRRAEANRDRVATSIALSIACALGLLLLAFPLAPWLAERFLPTGGVELVGVAFAASVSTVLLRSSTAFLQARHRFVRSGLCNLLRPGTFTLALVWVWISGLGLVAAGWLYLATATLAALVAYAPLVRWLRPSSLEPRYLANLLRFSVKSYAQAIVNQLNYRVDMFIVAYLVGDFAEVAFYHVAAGLAGLLWVVPDSYGQVIYPRLAACEDERERTRETVAGLRYVFAVVVVGAVAVALLAPRLVPLLFGADYAAATPLLVVLLPGVVAMAACKILTRYFMSRNRHQLNSLWILVAVGVDAVANVLLIPRVGILGASLAATLAYLSMTFGLFGAFLATAELRREDLRDFPGREAHLALATLRSALARLRGRA